MKTLTAAAALMAVATFAENIAEFSLDDATTINVDSGSTTRIEYLTSSSAATLVKIGGGRLEIAVIGNTNISITVKDGTLASVRPGSLNLPEQDRYLHLDASDTSTMVLEVVNGTNFVTRWNDANGGPHYGLNKLTGRPFVRSGELNGLSVLDFGGLRDSGIYGNPPKGHNDMTAAALTNDEMVLVKDVFYIWRDNDGIKDLPLAINKDGKEVTFCGPTPVGCNNALRRGKGGNGEDFAFADVTPPSSTSPTYIYDGQQISSVTSYKTSVGWHTANMFLIGTWNTTASIPTIEKLTSTYGFDMVCGNNSRYGGCRIAEVLVCTNTLSAAQRAYVNAYLSCKWFPTKIAAVRLEQGATLDVSAATWKIGALDVYGTSAVNGETNLVIESTKAYTNDCISVSGVWKVTSGGSVLLPNLSFSGNGGIEVAAGSAKGNIVYADGRFEKTGAGDLSIAYLGGNVGSVTVSEGLLAISPLANPASAMHFDAARTDLMTVEESDGRKLISRWNDSDNSERAMVENPDKYKFDSSRQVNRPYLVEDYTNGLPVVDFGSVADCNHTEGWGAGLKATHPVTANGFSDPAFLQGFVVWEDRDDAIDLPPVSGSEVAGPSLFSGSTVWRRGDGCNGSGFALSAGISGYPTYFYSSLYVDFTIVPNGKSYRIPRGMHLLDTRPNAGDKGYAVKYVGCNSDATATNGQSVAGIYGGTRIGEFMFFKYYLPSGQRERTAAALGAKWFNRDNLCEYNTIDVSHGASLSLPYTDVSVTNLFAGGEISARTVVPKNLSYEDGARIAAQLKLEDNCRLALRGNRDALVEMSADSLVLSGKCALNLDDVDITGIFGRKMRIIATSSVSGTWPASSTVKSGVPVRVRFHSQSDGLYAEFRAGSLVVSFK